MTTARRACSSSFPDPHDPLAGQPAVAAHERDGVLLEPRQLRRVVEIVDDLVAAAQDGFGVEPVADGLAHARHAPCLGEQLGRAEQRLGRHARIEGALPADEVRLDDRRGMAAIGRAAREHLAGRPGADHDHIEFARVHRSLEPTPSVPRAPILAAALARTPRGYNPPPRGCSSVG